MADRVLFISWGSSVRGSEERGLEVFNAAIGLYGRMQQDGRIEGFDVMLMNPNGAMAGCIQVQGSAEQLAMIREDEEFQRSMVDAAMIVDDLRLMDGFINDGIARRMAMYQEAISQVPQRA
jgi:hypothetical protein